MYNSSRIRVNFSRKCWEKTGGFVTFDMRICKLASKKGSFSRRPPFLCFIGKIFKGKKIEFWITIAKVHYFLNKPNFSSKKMLKSIKKTQNNILYSFLCVRKVLFYNTLCKWWRKTVLIRFFVKNTNLLHFWCNKNYQFICYLEFV